MPGIDLSSTELRDRVAAGKSLRYAVPGAVDAYIRDKKLYAATEE
jgi:nicotinate-nucleotide adenylyltransferase